MMKVRNLIFKKFSYLFIQGKSLAGIVMEAAFVNIHEAIQTHYMSLVNKFQINRSNLIILFCSSFVGNHGFMA
jgi:hypothetical protein